MNARTGTANERIGQQAVDLADARKTRDWYIEKYLAILERRDGLLDALRQIASGAGEFTARELARDAIKRAGG